VTVITNRVINAPKSFFMTSPFFVNRVGNVLSRTRFKDKICLPILFLMLSKEGKNTESDYCESVPVIYFLTSDVMSPRTSRIDAT